MPPDDLLCLHTRSRFLDAPDVQRAVLPLKAAHATHVVAVIRKLIAREAVLGRVRKRGGCVRKCVPIFTFPAVWTAATREEDAAILVPRCVCPREARVAFDIAARLGLYFAV